MTLEEYIKQVEPLIEGIKVDLRDQFAMAALNGIIMHPQGPAGVASNVAKHAYEIADAMLEAKKK